MFACFRFTFGQTIVFLNKRETNKEGKELEWSGSARSGADDGRMRRRRWKKTILSRKKDTPKIVFTAIFIFFLPLSFPISIIYLSIFVPRLQCEMLNRFVLLCFALHTSFEVTPSRCFAEISF